jgi:uncharacterized protein DUF1778
MNLRLNVNEEERNLIRRAAALAGYRSMAAFCREVVLAEAYYIDHYGTLRENRNVAPNVAASGEQGASPRPDEE